MCRAGRLVLFVFLMLDTARLRCGFTGSVTPTYAAMRQALSRVPSPMDHPAMNYYVGKANNSI